MAQGQPNVAYVRPEVEALLPQWQMISDVIAGEASVKRHDLDTLGSSESVNDLDLWWRYLPQPNAADTSDTNRERYRQYIERAIFFPATARTHAGLIGQAFLRPPIIELPVGLEYLETDIDGAGVSLVAQARKALGHALASGSCGLLTDYPAVDGTLTAAQQEAMNIRPTILLYRPEQLINWRTIVVGAKRMLSLVVLAETYETSDDGFQVQVAPQWRVLRLDETQGLVVELYRDATTNGKTERVLVNGYPREPKNGNGQRLNYIPFQPIGAVNNDPEPDPSPMYDHASLNIAHYRMYADYAEGVHFCGQDTFTVNGLTETWYKNILKEKIPVGSRGGLPLPSGASADLLHAEGNGLAFEAIQHLERQMVALGAKLIEQKAVNITATEARQQHATEISVLGGCAVNVAEAYTLALNWCADFSGAEQTAKLEIDPEFELGSLTAQELQTVLTCWKDNAISTSEMRDKLRAAGYATQSLEDFEAEMAKKTSVAAPEPVAPAVVMDNPEMPVVGDQPGDQKGGA